MSFNIQNTAKIKTSSDGSWSKTLKSVTWLWVFCTFGLSQSGMNWPGVGEMSHDAFLSYLYSCAQKFTYWILLNSWPYTKPGQKVTLSNPGLPLAFIMAHICCCIVSMSCCNVRFIFIQCCMNISPKSLTQHKASYNLQQSQILNGVLSLVSLSHSPWTNLS